MLVVHSWAVVVVRCHCGEFGEVVGRCTCCCELAGGALLPVEGVVVVMWGARSPVVVLAGEGDGGVQGVIVGG